METDSIPQQIQDEPKQQPDSADIVVGLLTDIDPEAVAAMCDALRTLPNELRIAVLQADERKGLTTRSDATKSTPLIFFPSWPLAKPNTAAPGALSMLATYQSVFSAAEKLQARACCVLSSKLESPTPELACDFLRPLLEENIDLVVPHYARRKFEGLLNSGIIAPLIRALYGKRLRNPMGPDLGMSQRLFQKFMGSDRASRSGGNGLHPLASVAPSALCENMRVAEVCFGTRVYPPPDWTNTSSLLADALSPVFLDMERNASCWQRARISAVVPEFGEPVNVDTETGTVDTQRLVDSFTLGNRELQEIWGLVLPPHTLFELRKLSRLTPEQFRMPDELWVRIVYDFALAHRLRTINRDHLLKSMTPLYLGWVASYAHDLQADETLHPDQRIDRLALAFEAGKPYLVSRWRWPDRFNP